jgi:hypothetical protein
MHGNLLAGLLFEFFFHVSLFIYFGSNSQRLQASPWRLFRPGNIPYAPLIAPMCQVVRVNILLNFL